MSLVGKQSYKILLLFHDRDGVHAAVKTSKEALLLRRLVETFDIIHDLVRVHCDSQSYSSC